MLLIPCKVDNAEKKLRNSIKRKNDKPTEFAMVFEPEPWALGLTEVSIMFGMSINPRIDRKYDAYGYFTTLFNIIWEEELDNPTNRQAI